MTHSGLLFVERHFYFVLKSVLRHFDIFFYIGFSKNARKICIRWTLLRARWRFMLDQHPQCNNSDMTFMISKADITEDMNLSGPGSYFFLI